MGIRFRDLVYYLYKKADPILANVLPMDLGMHTSISFFLGRSEGAATKRATHVPQSCLPIRHRFSFSKDFSRKTFRERFHHFLVHGVGPKRLLVGVNLREFDVVRPRFWVRVREVVRDDALVRSLEGRADLERIQDGGHRFFVMAGALHSQHKRSHGCR